MGISIEKSMMMGIILTLLTGCATTPNPYDRRKPDYLLPYGPAAESTPLIRHVEADSPASSLVEVGDRIIDIDGKPVPNTYGFYQMLSPEASTIKVQGKGGSEKSIPVSKLIEPNTYHSWAWLYEPGQTLVFKLDNPTYGEEQNAALVIPKDSIALVTASIWPTSPRYLEIYIELRVNLTCTDCKLENIAVLDLSRNSWLTPVSSDHVAWALYPAAGQAPNLMAVPPPTPIGYTGTTSTTGSVNAYNYGNYTSGTYSGTGLSTVTPYYDYTATNIAMAYNLGAMFQQSQIQAHGSARDAFVTRRQSNLRIGQLNPGELITGFVHYQLPEGFDGPFLVAVQAGKIGIARFDKK